MPRGTATTRLGEAAALQISLRLLDHDWLTGHIDEMTELPGRHVWHEHDQVRHNNTVVDLVAVAENFTSRRLLELRPSLTDNDVFSWEKRRKAWAKHAQVDLTKITQRWESLLGFVQARNALQHGLGYLTDFQLSPHLRVDVLSQIEAARITLFGNRVYIDSGTVSRCAEVCVDFVLTLDKAAPAA